MRVWTLINFHFLQKQPWRCSMKIAVLRNFAIFTRLQNSCFLVNIAKIFNCTYLEKHLQMAACISPWKTSANGCLYFSLKILETLYLFVACGNVSFLTYTWLRGHIIMTSTKTPNFVTFPPLTFSKMKNRSIV